MKTSYRTECEAIVNRRSGKQQNAPPHRTPPAEWRAVAKDGYPLSGAQAIRKPATLLFDPGEIYDYEFTPGTSGDLSLEFGPPPPPPATPGAAAFPPVTPPVVVVVHVH